MKTILGISAFYHDSAATLIYDGEVIAAAQEERFSRKKHDAEFPEKAIKYCLSTMGIQLADVDHIVFFEKPFLKFERLLETYVAFAPKGINSFKAAMPIWLRERLFQKNLLLKKFKKLIIALYNLKNCLSLSIILVMLRVPTIPLHLMKP